MKTIFDSEALKRAGTKAAWVAKNGTPEQKSGRFLPPPDWKGELATSKTARQHPVTGPLKAKV